MLIFILTISCLTTANLPWFMDLTFQVPMQCCSSQHQIYHQTHPQLSVISDFAQPLHSLWSYCSSPPLFPSSILDTFRPGGLIFWCHTILAFYRVHEVLTASILGWFADPPPVDHILSELSAMTQSWVALHGMAHSFIELHKPLCHGKAVILEGD